MTALRPGWEHNWIEGVYRGDVKLLAIPTRWPDTLSADWQSDRGGIGIREMIALLAVAVTILAAATAILEVSGFDVAGWLREQFADPG